MYMRYSELVVTDQEIMQTISRSNSRKRIGLVSQGIEFVSVFVRKDKEFFKTISTFKDSIEGSSFYANLH